MKTGLLVAILSGLGAMFGWGLADFFAKKTVDRIGDFKTLMWAQTIGVIPLLWLFAYNPVLPPPGIREVLYVLAFGLADVFGYLMFYRALEKGQVSLLSPIFASYAAVAVLISAFFFKEAIPGYQLLALSIVFLGIVLTSLDIRDLRNSLKAENRIKGLGEVLLGVVIFAFWFPLWDNFIPAGSWLYYTLLLRLFNASILLVASGIRKERIWVDRGQGLWRPLILIGLFDVAAYVLVSAGFDLTTHTSVITMLSAAFSLPTLILAHFFLKERLNTPQMAGVLAIICGVVLLSSHG